jgi:hypothetical protein
MLNIFDIGSKIQIFVTLCMMGYLHLALVLFSLALVVQGAPGYWNGRSFSARLIAPTHYESSTDRGIHKQWGSRSRAKNSMSARLRAMSKEDSDTSEAHIAPVILRGGDKQSTTSNGSLLDQTVSVTLQILTTICRTVLPPLVAVTKIIVGFYSILPVDATLGMFSAHRGNMNRVSLTMCLLMLDTLWLMTCSRGSASGARVLLCGRIFPDTICRRTSGAALRFGCYDCCGERTGGRGCCRHSRVQFSTHQRILSRWRGSNESSRDLYTKDKNCVSDH